MDQAFQSQSPFVWDADVVGYYANVFFEQESNHVDSLAKANPTVFGGKAPERVRITV